MICGKKLGEGYSAAVYEWGEGKVIKLFHPSYSKEAVEKEFHNAKAIHDMCFAKPRAYDLVSCKEQMGIVYDRVEGKSLQEWVLETRDMPGCAEHMAKLHKAILRNNIRNVPDYKEFLRWGILNATSIGLDKQKEALKTLDQLPDGNTLCHGDFHPGNIFISNGCTIAIDFMNICCGNFLYDVARTVFLVQYTPVPVEAEDKEMILQFKKTLADLYLMQMEVDRERIQNYLSVIMVARMGECPNESSYLEML